MSLHEIVYKSRETHSMALSELVKLLEQSRRNNARMGVTGVLIYHKGEFLQMLEGEKEVIFQLYDTICSDPRNCANQLIWDGSISARSFESWSMAFVLPVGRSIDRRPAYAHWFAQGLGEALASSPHETGRSFLLHMCHEFLQSSSGKSGRLQH